MPGSLHFPLSVDELIQLSGKLLEDCKPLGPVRTDCKTIKVLRCGLAFGSFAASFRGTFYDGAPKDAYRWVWEKVARRHPLPANLVQHWGNVLWTDVTWVSSFQGPTPFSAQDTLRL